MLIAYFTAPGCWRGIYRRRALRIPIPEKLAKRFTFHAKICARVALSSYAQPDFMAMTPAKGALAIIGVAAALADGKSFVLDNGIADPSLAFGEGIRKAMVDKFGALPVARSGAVVGDDSVGAISRLHADSDYVVDAKTLGWGYGYAVPDVRLYRTRYRARVRLIDIKLGKVIAEDFCVQTQEDNVGTVSFDTLTAQRAQYFKNLMGVYVAECVNAAAARMFKLAGPTVAVPVLSVPAAAGAAAAAAQPARLPGSGAPAQAASLAQDARLPDRHDPVPFLKAHGQERFRQFLQRPLPRAFAISDTGYSAATFGRSPSDPSLPKDPAARALIQCKAAAGKECVLYMVNKEIVYRN